MSGPAEEVSLHGPIVVGVDGSRAAEQAVTQAVAIAAATGLPLHLVAVSPDRHEREAERSQEEEESVRLLEQALAAAGATAEASGLARFDTHRRHGDPAEAILELAAELGAGLIVVGGGRIGSIVRFLLGSVADEVSHHAPCDVLITASGPARPAAGRRRPDDRKETAL